jgi:hypothetical protein
MFNDQKEEEDEYEPSSQPIQTAEQRQQQGVRRQKFMQISERDCGCAKK